MKLEFTVFIVKDILKVVNNSSFTLIVSIRPKKPLRKHVDFMVVLPGEFCIYENLDKINLCIKDFSFRFGD